VLALVVFALTDGRNAAGPGARLAPVFIGLTVSALISVIAPLTQASFNPARDFGPRLFAFFGGWGAIALPGPRGTGFLTVYIVAPVVGALVGASLYDLALRPTVGSSCQLSVDGCQRETPAIDNCQLPTAN
jgi:glycerol uptake facilitator protein